MDAEALIERPDGGGTERVRVVADIPTPTTPRMRRRLAPPDTTAPAQPYARKAAVTVTVADDAD